MRDILNFLVERKEMKMTKIRGFELVSSYTNQDLLPKRETAHAAGYDLKVAERTVIAPGEIVPRPDWGQGLYASG